MSTGLLNGNGLKEHTDQKVYLDYNATTPLDIEVSKSISDCLVENWSNPSSQYKRGIQAKHLINESRRSISNMINSKSFMDIIFVSGGTEANNLVFNSVLKHYNYCKKKAHDRNNNNPTFINQLPHIIISRVEHDSVKLIAESYEKENLAEITYVSVNQHGTISVDDVIDSIKSNTVLISIMMANNESGVIQPIGELGNRLNSLGYNKNENFNDPHRICPLYLHTDAAQTIGKIKVDVEELQCDYLTIVGHKFYGPRIGALYARNCLNQDQHIELVNESENTKKAPIYHLFYGANQENGLRPGTENTPMIVGLGRAADLVIKNLEKYSNNMKEVRDYLEKRLEEEFGLDNLRFNGRSTKSKRIPNTCNVSFIGSEEFKGYMILNKAKYLEASTGACCHSGELKASKILLEMKIDKSVASNAIRLSVGRETSKTDIDLVINDLKQTLNLLSSA